MIGGIISAGAGLLGSIFGKKEKKQEVVNRVDYARMVKDAEAAGFNPLTALRNGGAAGFGVQSMPSMTNSNVWGDALQSGLDAWNKYDPHEQKREKLSHDLMSAQLRNIEADTALKMNPRRSFDVPVKMASTRVNGTSLADAPLGAPTAPEAGDVTVTNPWEKAHVDPTVRDAEAIETRYGDSEVVSGAYGAHVGYKDFMHNRKIRREEQEKEWAEKNKDAKWYRSPEQRQKDAKDRAQRPKAFIDRSRSLHKRDFGSGSKSFW